MKGDPSSRTLPPTLSGAVYDRGYRPYQAPRGGRREATIALWRLSVRRALGLRRSWRQKVFPWSLLAIATVPAIVNVGIGYAIKGQPDGDPRLRLHHLPRVRGRLDRAVAVRGPDRPRRGMSRPGAGACCRWLFSAPTHRAVDYVVAKVGGPSPRSCSGSASCPRSCSSSGRCW